VLAADQARFSFSHDLLEDWSRFKWIEAREGDLHEISARSSLPPWHRAIRLYALRVLRVNGSQDWLDRQTALREIGDELAGDLFLDALLFAGSPAETLAGLWGELSDGNGMLLNRLLGRLVQVGTVPDPRADLMFPDVPELAAYWNATMRIPLVSFWTPVLQVLSENATAAVEKAPDRVAEVTRQWLQYAPAGPARSAAAKVALELGNSLRSGSLSEVFINDDQASKLWQAVIQAGAEDPARVATLLSEVLDDGEPEGNEDVKR
jgi:hypothetical protein